MTRYLPDTTCLIAAVCGWHEHNEQTRAALAVRAERGDELVLAAPCLVEMYAVLTRLPPPHRLRPQDAWALVEGNFGESPAVALGVAEYWRVLREAHLAGIVGGQVYDAAIAACARKARVEVLLTWNLRHFERFNEGFQVLSP